LYEVVAFTAAQIPNITGRKYPPELAGPNYPNGIPIYPEEQLPELVKKFDVEQVILAYSDLVYEDVMHKASMVLATGADFRLMGPKSTMLESKVPIIAICAVRTGSGKSPTTRRVVDLLKEKGIKVVVIRHPMPYGDLRKQVCQRFASYEDLDRYECTIEEREEYEPLIDRGVVVYAGVDYEKILREAEKEADLIIWDGGNNDFPFYKPDLFIVVADPHRAGQEVGAYPGEANARMADVLIINKVETAPPENIEKVRRNLEKINPNAIIIDAAMPLFVDNPEMIRGKRVLAVEDGPTVTHGHMPFGAGYLAARKFGAKEIIDPRPYAVGSIKEVYEEYTHLGPVLPAMGYGKEQIKELEETIKRTECDIVVTGTPIDIRRLIDVDKPVLRVRYELQEIGKPDLRDIIEKFLKEKGF
jgi:predicted GTPase